MEQRSEQNVCILVVDDEQDIRRIIRILLESSGYQVAEAPNGLAAVEYIRQQPSVYKGKTSGQLLRADVMLDEPGRRVLRGGRPVELTETEFEILCFLAARRGSVVSVEQIYEGVWHEKYMPSSTNTVMVHIVNLRKKLEEDPANPRLIRTVWGKGYQID